MDWAILALIALLAALYIAVPRSDDADALEGRHADLDDLHAQRDELVAALRDKVVVCIEERNSPCCKESLAD